MKGQNMIDLITKENDLILIRLPESGSTFFSAISHCLYFTDKKAKRIEANCLRYLYDLKSVDNAYYKKMNEENNLNLYTKNPRLPAFEALNLEIIARLYKVKIKLFYINEINLCCDIFNFKGNSTIRVFRVHDLHYEPAYKSKTLSKMIEMQNNVLSIVDNLFKDGKKEFSNQNHDFYLNFVWKRWKDDNNKLLSKAKKKDIDDDENVFVKNYDHFTVEPNEESIQKTLENFEEYYNNIVNRGTNSPKSSEESKSVSDNYSSSFKEPKKDNIMDGVFDSYGINFAQDSSLKDMNSLNSESETDLDNFQRMINLNREYKDDLSLPENPPPIHRKYSANNFQSNKKGFNNEQDWKVSGNDGVKESNIKNDEIEENKRYRGRLKFFDEKNNFGFLTLLEDETVDVFVFGSEFQRSKIPINELKAQIFPNPIYLEFDIVFYWGRHGKSKKAVNIVVI